MFVSAKSGCAKASQLWQSELSPSSAQRHED